MSAIEVRIIAGGTAEPEVESAIREAVTRIVLSKARSSSGGRRSGWTQAARLEAVGLRTVRSRGALPLA